jgi:hypothetical protein
MLRRASSQVAPSLGFFLRLFRAILPPFRWPFGTGASLAIPPEDCRLELCRVC